MAKALVSPEEATCLTPDRISVRVSNQSCSALTITGGTRLVRHISGPCWGGEDPGSTPYEFEIIPVTVASKTTREVYLTEIRWCTPFYELWECSMRMDVTIDTNRGVIQAKRSNVYSRTFSSRWCGDCSTYGGNQHDGSTVGEQLPAGEREHFPEMLSIE